MPEKKTFPWRGRNLRRSFSSIPIIPKSKNGNRRRSSFREPVKEKRITITQEEYERLTNSNPLTGLPGNKMITRSIEQKFLGSPEYSLVYFDISDFKAYNDTYGFEKGDL